MEKAMYGYVGFFKGKRLEIVTDKGIYFAQCELAKQFKAKKSYEVNVILAEKNGETVTHTAC